MMLAWLSTAVMGNDFGLDQGFIADSMLRVGFRSVCSRTLETPIGQMDLDIRRKYTQGMAVIKAFNQTVESFKKYRESIEEYHGIGFSEPFMKLNIFSEHRRGRTDQ